MLNSSDMFIKLSYLCMVLQDETFDKTTVHARLRLTIPREPDFETAHRAHRIRWVLALGQKSHSLVYQSAGSYDMFIFQA